MGLLAICVSSSVKSLFTFCSFFKQNGFCFLLISESCLWVLKLIVSYVICNCFLSVGGLFVQFCCRAHVLRFPGVQPRWFFLHGWPLLGPKGALLDGGRTSVSEELTLARSPARGPKEEGGRARGGGPL